MLFIKNDSHKKSHKFLGCIFANQQHGTCIETETSGTNIAKVDGATEKEKISCYFCNGKQTNPIAQFESTPRTVIKRILSAPPMNKSTKGTNRIDLLIVK